VMPAKTMTILTSNFNVLFMQSPSFVGVTDGWNALGLDRQRQAPSYCARCHPEATVDRERAGQDEATDVGSGPDLLPLTPS